MTLEILQESVKMAMKDQKTIEVMTIRGVIAAIQKAAIDRKCEITEELVNEMLLKECKLIQEQIDTCPADRENLLETYKQKLRIVKYFAPKLITDETEIKFMIWVALTSAGVDPETANKGQIMKAVMPALKGKVDMKIANQIIEKGEFTCQFTITLEQE